MSNDIGVDDRLDAFYSDLGSVDLQPLWTQARNLLPSTPKPAAVPWLWQGQTLRALAARARDLITIERGGERRVLALSNPGLGGAPFATSTLWGAIQALGAHESAPAHRHSASAIRFVLEGSGVWTTVDGDACHMHPGDLVLTPAWTFHDHTNDGDEPMIWFDGLDLPLIAALDASFFENHPDLNQPVRGFDLSEQMYGAGGRVPYGTTNTSPHSPLLVYRWKHSDTLLDKLLAASGGPMASIEFVDPTSGRPALPTMSCVLHRVTPGRRTPSRRKTGSSIFVVHHGTGQSVIGGQLFRWSPGDMFVVPSWETLDHEAETTADIFEVSDEATVRALCLFRDETVEQHQEITGVFEPRRVRHRVSADTFDTVDAVVRANRALGAAGQGDLIWGHASVRDPGGRGAWMKAAGWGFEEITEQRVVLVSDDGDVLAGEGRRHIEFPIHTEMYKRRPDVSAVVHSHAAAAVAFASLEVPVRALSHDGVWFADPDIPRFRQTGSLIRDHDLGCALAYAIGDGPGCLIPHHGLVTVGATVAEAVMRAVCLDRACQVQLLAMSAGGPHTWSDPGEVERKRAEVWTPEQIAAGFEYLCRLTND